MYSLLRHILGVLRLWPNAVALCCVTAVVGTYLMLVSPRIISANPTTSSPREEPTTTTTTTTIEQQPTTTTTATESTTTGSAATESTGEATTTESTQDVHGESGRGTDAEGPPGLAMPTTTTLSVEETTTTTRPVTTQTTVRSTTTTTNATTTTIPPRNKAKGLIKNDTKICYFIVDNGTKIQRPCPSD